MGFVTFATAESAKKALGLHEQECMGRRIKLSMAKPRKERPERKPRDRVKLRPVKPLSERPDECYTVFVGNLSYEVNDEQMIKFAEEKSEGQGTVTGVRWITDRETGDFKGAGFIEFDSVEAVDAFVKQNGKIFMGRQLRVDYAMPKN
uniref:RRM domain-containing protein n=2 Tax=Lotharella oceanica TaxID=641309 RepID=A0A7S2TKH7_9EUKA|mmetsp:Transcript_18488/g.34891  ORF Transcript_18488/g.34891 Transcript_18488/m.34891 type:complete len:148 (+) Transcript_18488:568-1011(+)